jgi:hypothetical protein
MGKMPQPPASLVHAAKLVFIAMAYEQSIRPKIEKIQKDLMDSMDIRYVDKLEGMRGKLPQEGQKMTDKDHLYMASDADAAAYFTAMDAAYKAAGFMDLKPGYCPLLIAEHTVGEAKQLLVKEATAWSTIAKMGMTAERIESASLESYKQFVDLILRMLAPMVKMEGTSQDIIRKFLASPRPAKR